MHEKRAHRRVPLNTDCKVEIGGVGIDGTARDISIGGMYVEAEGKVAFGQQVTITCTVPTSDRPLELPATVRWVDPGGFGVQFGLLGAKETHAIAELMKH